MDNSQKYAITTTCDCVEVWFSESKLAATQSFTIFEPSSSSVGVDKAAGTTHIFRRNGLSIWAGTTVGYVQLDAGSFTANIEQK